MEFRRFPSKIKSNFEGDSLCWQMAQDETVKDKSSRHTNESTSNDNY